VENNLPNASKIQAWQIKIETHSPAWQVFFPPSLTDPSCILVQLFSDLVSENSFTRQSGASLEKNLIHTPAPSATASFKVA
jgi:hypothetical protein